MNFASLGFGDPTNGQHSWTIGESGTRDIIKAALEGGINFFDTAIGYQNGIVTTQFQWSAPI